MSSAGGIASGPDATDLDAPGELALRPVAGEVTTRTAVAAADAAARAAGVRIRTLTELDDLDAVYRLYDAIWRPDPKNPPVTTELLRALTKAGNYVAGAFDGAGLVGACVGFFSAPAGTAMHSHVAGVSRAALGRSVGFALKLHQRAWAIQRGVSEIAWTFDPLVSRNAYFNLAKLAALADEYLPNFYGDMNDGINGTGDTDRLLVRWDLHASGVTAACAGSVRPASAADETARGAAVALARSGDGTPVAGSLGAATLLVAVPPDVETLRGTDPGCAQDWRLAIREVLGGAMADGGAVAGFDRAGWYIVTRQPASEEDGQ